MPLFRGMFALGRSLGSDRTELERARGFGGACAPAGAAAPAEFRHSRNVRPTPWVYEAASASPHPRLRINAPFVSTDLHDSLRPFG